MKRLFIVAAVVCAAAIGAPPPTLAAEPLIPIIVKDTTSLYWQMVLAGARKAGKDLGVNVSELGVQSEGDVKGQISTLEDAVAGKPAAVVIAPIQAAALGKPIDEAAGKVKVIGIDSSADTKAFAAFLGADEAQAGRIAADGLAAAILAKYGKAEGEVALIASAPGVASRDARVKGFNDELAAKYPGLKLVAGKAADGQAAGAASMMSDLIGANPNLRGVFAASPLLAQGVGQAIAEGKKADSIKAIGFGSDDKTAALLKDGALAGLVVPDPYRMGYDAIKTALAAAKGEKVEAAVDIDASLITAANMNEARSVALLSPKVR